MKSKQIVIKKHRKEFMKNNKLRLKTKQRVTSEMHNVLLKKLIRLL